MIEFLTPYGWLVATAALLPVGAALVRGRRDRRARGILGLARPPLRSRAAGTAAAVAVTALLAAAAAQPAIATGSSDRIRTDAQIFFVVDISRSMLAQAPHGTTRLDRARAVVERMQAALPDVPAGVASLTDRPLPHVFPTVDRSVVSAVLHRALGIERPPPQVGAGLLGRATAFDSIAQLASAHYFGRRVRHRLVILLTDGESTTYSPGAVLTRLRAGHVGLLVVRFWHADERVFNRARAESYRPDASTLGALRSMANRSVGLYGERRVGAAVRAARAWLGSGPTVTSGRPGRLRLAPYAALAAIVPLAFVLRRRDP